MDKCCDTSTSPPQQRRLHGLQFPLHCQQVLGWVIFLVTAVLNFTILTQIQFEELNILSNIFYAILYVAHIVSHLTASLMDASEMELRQHKVEDVPEFDRTIHAHVIENGRCHLCNINTSTKTKHCSVCNKCVDRFDHHCKWLNNCIGRRNYAAFMSSVVTALWVSVLTAALCLADAVFVVQRPNMLSPSAQNFINCSISNDDEGYCKNYILLLCFLLIYFGCAFAIACALMHLCCFHVYIYTLGISTYEYIVGKDDSVNTSACRTQCRVWKRLIDCARMNKYRTQRGVADTSISNNRNGHLNMPFIISNLINSQAMKANSLLFNKNKVHPSGKGNKK